MAIRKPAAKGLPILTQPLGLPQGSVRAVIALLVVAPLTIVALTSGIKITSEQYINVLTLVLGFYFIGKTAAAASRR